MPKKKTTEEYMWQVHKVAPHVIVKGEYDGNRTPIEHYCLKHDIVWNVSPFNFLQHPTGCIECQKELLNMYHGKRRKTDDQFIKEVDALGSGIKPIGEYTGFNNDMQFMCRLGHIWGSTPHEILDGYGCPYCAGQKVLIGFNDLWTTDPDIAKMLSDPNIGYEISRGSNRTVEWTCPRCGKPKMSTPKQVVVYGLACNVCSDGISYPNKFMLSVLKQLNVGFKNEVSRKVRGFEWVKDFKYDFYFEDSENRYFIEMDGGFHYGDGFLPYEDVHCTDVIKDELAANHGIIMIRIDCNYHNMSQRFEYVKRSIQNSVLNNIFDLSFIDWDKCNIDGTKSMHIKAAKLYDSGLSIREISDNLSISYSTIYSWLKRMSKEGLCSYNPTLGRNKKKCS